MTSPYVERAAQRAALISSRYDHDPKHFAFPRQATLPGDLEQTYTPEPWSHIILGWGLVIISGIGVAVALMAVTHG